MVFSSIMVCDVIVNGIHRGGAATTQGGEEFYERDSENQKITIGNDSR